MRDFENIRKSKEKGHANDAMTMEVDPEEAEKRVAGEDTAAHKDTGQATSTPSLNPNSNPSSRSAEAEDEVEGKNDGGVTLVEEEALRSLLDLDVNAAVAVQALEATGGSDVSAALEWVANNQDEVTRIQNAPTDGASGAGGTTGKNEGDQEEAGPRLTEEEAMEKALELQRRAREKRLAREKQEEKEREKRRIESSKNMQEARRHFEEQERKRLAMQALKEKNEAKAAEQRQKELLAQEYRERFNTDLNSVGKRAAEGPATTAPVFKKPRDHLLYCVQNLKRLLKNDQSVTPAKEEEEERKERILLALKTLRTYMSNCRENPLDKKFQTINTQNKIFQQRIAPFPDAIEMLNVVGFVPCPNEPALLKIQSIVPDGYLLSQGVEYLSFILK